MTRHYRECAVPDLVLIVFGFIVALMLGPKVSAQALAGDASSQLAALATMELR
jgi:hypothetical protein